MRASSGELPAAGRMHRVAEAGQYRVGQGAPPGRLPVPVPAGRPLRRGREGAQPADAREAGMRPVPVAEFPDARVGLGPAFLDRFRSHRRRLPVLLRQQVQAGGRGEKLERLTQPVELELADHALPAQAVPPGYPRSRSPRSPGWARR